MASHRKGQSNRHAVLDRINERWMLLSEHPYLGMARDDIAAGIRHLIVGAYVTFYRVGTDIEILRVLHGARDFTRIDIGE